MVGSPRPSRVGTDARRVERALVTFALTRTLNGVISVAQGTQLAFQPAGVGVVISAGEILDPLNDLVEQFSWLTLLAATSLGVQIMLAEMFATTAVNAALVGGRGAQPSLRCGGRTEAGRGPDQPRCG